MSKEKGYKTGEFVEDECLPALQDQAHKIAIEHGFWEGRENDNVPTKLALVHEEVSEALKSFRQTDMELRWEYTSTENTPPIEWRNEHGEQSYRTFSNVGRGEYGQWVFVPESEMYATMISLGYTAKPEGFPVELADVMIRLMDLAERMGIDLAEMINIKMAYNATRPYRHGRRV